MERRLQGVAVSLSSWILECLLKNLTSYTGASQIGISFCLIYDLQKQDIDITFPASAVLSFVLFSGFRALFCDSAHTGKHSILWLVYVELFLVKGT